MIPAPPPAAQNAPAIAGATATPQPAPAPMAAARAKREGLAMDSLGARELRKSIRQEADPDPQRELERIERLRQAGDHVAADRALEEFRKRHPDFRIPEAMWERVKPR